MKTQNRANSRGSAAKDKDLSCRILPAMPIRIVLSSGKANYTLETEGGEPIFRVRYPEHPDVELETRVDFSENGGAWELRESFENLQSPGDALKFLNALNCPFRVLRYAPGQIGPLPYLLSWLELKEWQKMVRFLRFMDPPAEFPFLLGFPSWGDRGSSYEEDFALYRKAFSASQTGLAQILSSASDDTFGLLKGIPSGLLIRRDMYLSRAEVDEIFSTPGSRTPGSSEWNHAQQVLKERRIAKARGTAGLKQALIAEIFTSTPLDAILATIYVDKLRGRGPRLCALRDCGVVFEMSSDSRKIYCSQAHAHLASVRQKREEARKAVKPSKLRKAS